MTAEEFRMENLELFAIQLRMYQQLVALVRNNNGRKEINQNIYTSVVCINVKSLELTEGKDYRELMMNCRIENSDFRLGVTPDIAGKLLEKIYKV